MFYLEYATTTALRMLLDVPATLLHTGAVGTDWTGHVATRRRWEGQKYPKVGYFAENAAQTDRGTSSRNSLRRQGQRGEGESHVWWGSMGIDAGRAPGRFGHLSGSAGRQTGSILAQLDGATTSPGGTVAVARWIVSGVKLLEPQSQGCGGRLCGRGRISHLLGQPQACTPSRARTAAVRPSKAL